MKNPWEDSLILALRDAQWIRANKRGDSTPDGVPGVFLKLSGQPEQNLGDLVFGSREKEGELFYLFEAKSGRNQVSTEWSKIIKGKPEPKLAFKTLTGLANGWQIRPREASHTQAIWTSLRCHHFLYWSDLIFEDDCQSSTVRVVPYLVGCVQDAAPGLVNDKLKRFGVAERLKEGNGIVKGASLPLGALLNESGLVVAMGVGATPRVRSYAAFGVAWERFKAYLTFLSEHGGAGDGSLNAIVCSNDGYLRRLEHFDDLKVILSKTAVRTPEKTSLEREPIYLKSNAVDMGQENAELASFPNVCEPSTSNIEANFSMRKKPKPKV